MKALTSLNDPNKFVILSDSNEFIAEVDEYVFGKYKYFSSKEWFNLLQKEKLIIFSNNKLSNRFNCMIVVNWGKCQVPGSDAQVRIFPGSVPLLNSIRKDIHPHVIEYWLLKDGYCILLDKVCLSEKTTKH